MQRLGTVDLDCRPIPWMKNGPLDPIEEGKKSNIVPYRLMSGVNFMSDHVPNNKKKGFGRLILTNIVKFY